LPPVTIGSRLAVCTAWRFAKGPELACVAAGVVASLLCSPARAAFAVKRMGAVPNPRSGRFAEPIRIDGGRRVFLECRGGEARRLSSYRALATQPMSGVSATEG
jgi:hypothetical protein